MALPSLDVVLDHPSGCLRPGELLPGRVRIRTDRAIDPASVELVLYWARESPNERKRSPDRLREELVCSRLDAGETEIAFTVPAPDDPPTFDGMLIHLTWHAEAVLTWGAESVTASALFAIKGVVRDHVPVGDESREAGAQILAGFGDADGVQNWDLDADAKAPPLVADMRVRTAPFDIERGGMLACRVAAHGTAGARLRQGTLSARIRLACREVARGDAVEVAMVYQGEWVPLDFINGEEPAEVLKRLRVPPDAPTTLESQDELLWSVDLELLEVAPARAVAFASYKFKTWMFPPASVEGSDVKGEEEGAVSVSDLLDRIDRGEGALSLSNRQAGTADDESLLEAAGSRDVTLVARLLADGADVNAQVRTMAIWASGEEFRTPLMAAAESGDVAVVRLLLERGADPRVEREIQVDVGYNDYKFEGTGRYECAADVARKAGHDEVARLLLEWNPGASI